MSLLMLTLSGFAQDRVTYTPVDATKPLTVLGDIVDFTGTELSLRSGASVQRISADRIQQIETHYQQEHLQAQQLFANGETAEALKLLRQALDKEPRAWVDREILAMMMQAELRQQNLAGAISTFQLILTSDPATRHWGIAPLIWSSQLISDSVRGEMHRWLVSDTPSQQLIAASILLIDPVLGEEAEQKLNSLTRNTQPIISAYAKSQLWRLEIASGKVYDVSLERWREQIQRLPKDLRPGPQYLYARGFEVTGDLRAAAAEALWLPMIYKNNEVLAARGLFDAAENLSRTGLNTEAENLYRELIVRYPWSRDAALARAKLNDKIRQ